MSDFLGHMREIEVDESTKSSIIAKCQENKWVRKGGYAWQDDPYLDHEVEAVATGVLATTLCVVGCACREAPFTDPGQVPFFHEFQHALNDFLASFIDLGAQPLLLVRFHFRPLSLGSVPLRSVEWGEAG